MYAGSDAAPRPSSSCIRRAASAQAEATGSVGASCHCICNASPLVASPTAAAAALTGAVGPGACGAAAMCLVAAGSRTDAGAAASSGECSSPSTSQPAPQQPGSARRAPRTSDSQQPPTPSTHSVPAPGSTLLAVHPSLSPAMARPADAWTVGDFTVVKKLQSGHASKVYQAVCKLSQEPVALKVYRLGKLHSLLRHQVYREVRLHAALDHPNIIRLHAAFKEGDSVVLVQEYAAGGDLHTFLRRYKSALPERRAVQMVLAPLLGALGYLHARGIVHRDIKLENVLLTGERCLKLADFGLAINAHEERPVTRAGTLDYMAPEVVRCPSKVFPEENKHRVALQYGSAVDVWALGVLAVEVVGGECPFRGATPAASVELILGAEARLPERVSEPGRAFMRAALAKAAGERATVAELMACPFIRLHLARLPVKASAAAAANIAASTPFLPSSRKAAQDADAPTSRAASLSLQVASSVDSDATLPYGAGSCDLDVLRGLCERDDQHPSRRDQGSSNGQAAQQQQQQQQQQPAVGRELEPSKAPPMSMSSPRGMCRAMSCLTTGHTAAVLELEGGARNGDGAVMAAPPDGGDGSAAAARRSRARARALARFGSSGTPRPEAGGGIITGNEQFEELSSSPRPDGKGSAGATSAPALRGVDQQFKDSIKRVIERLSQSRQAAAAAAAGGAGTPREGAEDATPRPSPQARQVTCRRSAESRCSADALPLPADAQPRA